MITLHWVEQGSPQWLADRVGKYTGSNAHKLLGSHGALEYAKAVASSFKGNFHTKRGHLLEDEAIGLYEKIHKVDVRRPGYVTNSRYPSCLYSPDGLAPVALLEVKCFAEKEHMKLVSGQVKLSVKAQIHFGLMITGCKYAELIAYNPNMDNPREAFKIIRVARNRDILNNFKRILQEVE